MRTANPWFGALPSHLAPPPPMDAVKRLGGLPAPPSHLWLPAICIVKSLARPEVLRPVIQVRCLILLLVAHDAFPFRVRPKNPQVVPERSTCADPPPRATCALFRAGLMRLTCHYGARCRRRSRSAKVPSCCDRTRDRKLVTSHGTFFTKQVRTA